MILDGALATELQRRGADLNDPLWSARVLLEQPELIRAVHRDYFAAGADVATTASYQATFQGFERRGIAAPRAAELMRDSVALAIAARQEFWDDGSDHGDRLRPLVAASVGPYGAMLADGSEYRGHYGLSEAQLMDFHRPRLQVLAASGADLLACETLPGLGEAIALARLLEAFPETAAWISFSCRDANLTCEGQPIGECVAALNAFTQVVGVGVNCTAPQYVEALLTQMREHTDKPLLAYPNSGEHYDLATKRWSATAGAGALHRPDGPDGPEGLARRWRAAGARLIGGCCRTTPDDIRRMRAGLSQCA